MTENPTFIQALADASQRPVEIAPVREATARGAALMAGLAVGHHKSVDDLASTWQPRARVEPRGTLDRDRWREAMARARGWIPELSGIDL
jgi:glycerol kinase